MAWVTSSRRLLGITVSILTLGRRSTSYSISAVDLFVALLAAMPAHFGYGQAVDAESFKSFFHFLELKGLDDGFDFFHWSGSGRKGHAECFGWTPARMPAWQAKSPMSLSF